MKIYNEIVIDMNPESSSYRETLHEDSFEYEGALALCDWKIGPTWYGTDGKGYYERLDWEGGIDYIKHSQLWQVDEDGTKRIVYDDADSTQTQLVRPKMDEKFAELSGGTQKFQSSSAGKGFTETDFTFTESGEFDPTSQEFRKSVEETGGYAEIAAGYGKDVEDFEKFYGKPLDFLEEEYGEEGTLAAGRGLDLATIAETKRAGGVSYDIAGQAAQERLRSAKAGYGLGMEAASLQTGRSLFDVKQQTGQQIAKSGFATQGTVSGVAGRAQKGIMADYNLQQKELAEGMTQAQSAFGISQKEIAEGRKGLETTTGIAEDRVGIAETQAGIDYERGKESFWKGTEEEYYNRLDYIESLR